MLRETADDKPVVDVAVVIPSYNGVRRGYVFRAVDSVLMQTVRPKEFMVIDDGSDDGTAEELRRRYPGLIVHSKPNGGLPDARNYALKLVSAEKICFLDDDDEWDPEKLAEQARHLDENPDVAMTFCGADFIDEKGRVIGGARPNDIGLQYPGLLLGNNILPPSTVMFRRSLLEAAGPFDVTLRQGEDYEYFVRCSKHGRISIQDKPLVRYRRHSTQMSQSLIHIDEVTLKILKRHAEADFPRSAEHFVRFFCYGAAARALTRRDWSTASRFLRAEGLRFQPLEFFLRFVGVCLQPLRSLKGRWRRWEVRRVLARALA